MEGLLGMFGPPEGVRTMFFGPRHAWRKWGLQSVCRTAAKGNWSRLKVKAGEPGNFFVTPALRKRSYSLCGTPGCRQIEMRRGIVRLRRGVSHTSETFSLNAILENRTKKASGFRRWLSCNYCGLANSLRTRCP